MSATTTPRVDPKSLRPGTVVRYDRFPSSTRVLKRRKDDDSGWWNTDGSGFSDGALMWGDWTVTDEAPTAEFTPHVWRCSLCESLTCDPKAHACSAFKRARRAPSRPSTAGDPT